MKSEAAYYFTQMVTNDVLAPSFNFVEYFLNGQSLAITHSSHHTLE